MANVDTQSGRNSNAAQVFNQKMPDGGLVKAMNVRFNLTGGTDMELNLEIPMARGVIEQVQAVYIDNRNAVPFYLTPTTTGQVIVAVPQSQGWYPVLSGNPAKFIGGASLSMNVDCIFLNVPMPASVWSALVADGSGIYAGSVVDHSLASAGNVLAVAANKNRKYLLVTCNTAAFGVNFVGNDASPGQPGAIDCVMGEKWETGDFVPTSDVYVFSTGALVTVIEGF